MIIQYTRIITSNADGSILHCTSQDFPFADGWEPVDYDSGTATAHDFEMVTDYVDQDHGVGRKQEMLRGRQIIDNFEIVGGQPRLKSGAAVETANKVLSMTSTKAIDESAIRVEMETTIAGKLVADGSSEKQLLDGASIKRRLNANQSKRLVYVENHADQKSDGCIMAWPRSK